MTSKIVDVVVNSFRSPWYKDDMRGICNLALLNLGNVENRSYIYKTLRGTVLNALKDEHVFGSSRGRGAIQWKRVPLTDVQEEQSVSDELIERLSRIAETDNEWCFIILRAAGYKNCEIAQALDVSQSEVSRMKSRLEDRFYASN